MREIMRPSDQSHPVLQYNASITPLQHTESLTYPYPEQQESNLQYQQIPQSELQSMEEFFNFKEASTDNPNQHLTVQDIANDISQYKHEWNRYKFSSDIQKRISKHQNLSLQVRKDIVNAVAELHPEMKDFEKIDLKNYLSNYRDKNEIKAKKTDIDDHTINDNTPELTVQNIANNISEYKNKYNEYKLSSTMQKRVSDQQVLTLQVRKDIVNTLKKLHPEMTIPEEISLRNYLERHRHKK